MRAVVNQHPVRVLIAKPGLDGHDRGAKVVTRALRDAGFEVIYTGRHQSVDAITATILDEDVDVVGLSILSGAHIDYCTRLAEGLRAAGRQDVALLVGGVIPQDDVQTLTELGYSVFPTGSALDEIVECAAAGRTERKS
ncbi:MAG: cobalamin-dependent protein [Acidimicrobiia bacterium]